MAHTARRRGVSLVEILIVIAILAIMIGLLLPAISSVRASSIHMQSVNNVRQINLSLQTLLSQNSDQITKAQGCGRLVATLGTTGWYPDGQQALGSVRG